MTVGGDRLQYYASVPLIPHSTFYQYKMPIVNYMTAFPIVIVAVSCSSEVHLLIEKQNSEILKWAILILSIDTHDIT